MKTSKENLIQITKILSTNTDYVGSNGMLHVQVQISFLNMVGLVFKFMIAFFIMLPIAMFLGFMLLGFTMKLFAPYLPTALTTGIM